MDYARLAEELMRNMNRMHRHRPQKQMSNSLHGEQFVLQFISMSGGDVIPSEISREMEISTARVAAALGSLEGKGLVTRRIDTRDRRRILVSLTDAGRVQAENSSRSLLAMVTEMLERLGERDAREYVRIMGRLIEMKPHFPD